jgi:hypothetical protein
MKASWLMVLALGSVIGCVEPSVPTGPAAEASTDAIEITMDSPVTDENPTIVEE